MGEMKQTGNDRNAYLQEITAPLRESMIRSAIETLKLKRDSNGLDIGCGSGLPTILLAEAAGQGGCVTGLDISKGLLDYAEKNAIKAGLSERTNFKLGNADNLPFDANVFDWAWSVDCVGYAPFDPHPPLREMMRVVKSGGKIAILAWSSEKLLPGYPELEARLSATSAGIAPFAIGMKPKQHFLRAAGWFWELGLSNIKAYTFVSEVYAPLSDDIRKGLIELLNMRWPDVDSEVSMEDWAEFRRLSRQDSPDFILDLPDYYAFFTYSMFMGKVVK